MKNLETPVKTGRVGRYAEVQSLVTPGSYLHFCGVKLNSTSKFNQNSASESAAAFLLHGRLALVHYLTQMRHRFKCQISTMSETDAADILTYQKCDI